MDVITQLSEWLKQWSGWSKIQKNQMDGLGIKPFETSLRPCGVEELERRYNIVGDAVARLRYRFLLDIRLEKNYGDEQTSTENAQWIFGLQQWVAQQSTKGLAPRFGTGEEKETIKAQNGSVTKVEREGMAIYQLEIIVECNQDYKEENNEQN